jgi:hypothetical protein
MPTVVMVFAVLAFAGAAASWIAGAVLAGRSLAAAGRGDTVTRLLAFVTWPFAARRLQGQGTDHAASLNKAIVAFFVCVTLGVALVSASTNLQRFSK